MVASTSRRSPDGDHQQGRKQQAEGTRMTRVLSALVLLAVVIGTVWCLPAYATFLLTALVALLAFSEYRTIAKALGADVPSVIGGVAVLLVCVAMWNDRILILPNDVYLVLMAALVVIGARAVARGQVGPSALADAAATAFAPIYLGLPLGALAAMRREAAVAPADGRLVLLLLAVVIIVSDSAQYYTGRAFGRRPLAPAISPKKTVEGAIGGVVFATLATVTVGHYVFPSPLWILALLGAVLSLLGIVGDLFESLLKRSAGVKDSSNLIPGHGGVLDRIDSWLFAAPVYYMFVRFVA
jgi:phosphatidate cytidylyltransferase